MKPKKKRPAWVQNPRAEMLISHLVPIFGNQRHVRAGECWALLKRQYAREVKGEKTLENIRGLEAEIESLIGGD